jgi:hypothetical protein
MLVNMELKGMCKYVIQRLIYKEHAVCLDLASGLWVRKVGSKSAAVHFDRKERWRTVTKVSD